MKATDNSKLSVAFGGLHSMDDLLSVFVGFAAEDRYTIAEPIVYHLKNYGIPVWYDRHKLLLGDNRKDKNLIEGVGKPQYACIIISENTKSSICAMEEFAIIKERFLRNEMIVFPILYELPPSNVPVELHWVKDIIFKEANSRSGTRDICNHIACKITENILSTYALQHVEDVISVKSSLRTSLVATIICKYLEIDQFNLNGRIALLYSAFLVMTNSKKLPDNVPLHIATCVYNRLFSETKLNLPIDYRELWLLEKCICIIANYYLENDTASKI